MAVAGGRGALSPNPTGGGVLRVEMIVGAIVGGAYGCALLEQIGDVRAVHLDLSMQEGPSDGRVGARRV